MACRIPRARPSIRAASAARSPSVLRAWVRQRFKRDRSAGQRLGRTQRFGETAPLKVSHVALSHGEAHVSSGKGRVEIYGLLKGFDSFLESLLVKPSRVVATLEVELIGRGVLGVALAQPLLFLPGQPQS